MKRLTIPELAIKIGTDKFDDHDLLDRKGLAKQLSELVDRIDDPIVIALDGSWGSGKSVFLKLWVGEHNQTDGAKARVIYFDAFENDFLDDPLIGLVGAIAKHLPLDGRDRQGLAKLKGVALSLGRSALRVGVAWATAGAIRNLDEIGDAVAGSISDESKKVIDGLWQKEQEKSGAMVQFREALVSLTKPVEVDGPRQKIVLIIDELDRCRPDHALSMLETIKHFFAVDGVHFVLGANMRALENSVKAQYGSGINAHEYLQKFVHLTVGLPKSKSGAGSPSLVYFPKAAKQMGIDQNLVGEIKVYLDLLVNSQPTSLRDIERILTQAALLPNSFSNFAWQYKSLLAGTLILKIVAPTLYIRLLSSQLNINDIANLLFGGAVPSETTDRVGNNIAELWSYFLNRNPDNAEVVRGQDKFGLGLQRPAGTLPRTLALEHLETFTLPPDRT